MVEGSCLCGTVSYEVEGPFVAMMHCHCSMCRKHHGSLFATFAVAPLAGFRFLSGEGDCVAYQSSKEATRSFCRACGSVTPTLMPAMGLAVVPAGNLEGEPGMRPQMHVFVGSKVPWHELSDDLPKHEGAPPEWGGGMGIERPAVTPREGIAEGSCLCGDIAFDVRGAARRAYHCHCSRCRRARSAAHATNFFFDADAFTWTRGEAGHREFKLPEARFFTTSFCGRCGSMMPRVNRERNVAMVPAGCFDVHPASRPEAHIFVASKAPWDEVTGPLPRFEEMPTA